MSHPEISTQHDQLSFDDTEIAFRSKSDEELKRAYWLFSALNNNFLATLGPKLINFSLKIGLPVEPLIRKTIFRQFCGGETIEECERVIRQLASGKVGTILDYAVEGEQRDEVFDETAKEIIRTIIRAKNDNRIPLTVFKPSGVARFGLLEKISANGELNEAEQQEWDLLERRVDQICSAAFNCGVPVMVDAEETWIQDAIDSLVLKMMARYNRDKVIVCNTYQAYRAGIFEILGKHIEHADSEQFMFGVKLVRGAYMEKERERARELGYASPIQPDKAATDKAYNDALKLCVQHIDRVQLIAGTHNEESCRVLVKLISDYGLPRDHDHIYFSQLLGMSDSLSFNLADSGYNVAKYVPYGPVKSVMPYLFRRAEENTAIAGQTGRELGLIVKERRRRMGY